MCQPPLAATSLANSKAYQDMSQVRTVLLTFLSEQAMGSPEKSVVTIGEIDPALKLPACVDVKAFFPAGSRAWGKTSVGARCDAPQAWTIYVQASVSVQARYIVASNPLPKGQVITLKDIYYETGDLSKLPNSIFTDASQLIGKTVAISMPAGTILKQEMVKSSIVIQQGQKVTLIANGQGFRISSDGVALSHAAEGQVVQVRLGSKKVVSGIAQSGGSVVVVF